MKRWLHRGFIPLLLMTVVLSGSMLAHGQEITLQHCWDGHRQALLEEILEEFEAAHPGVTVNALLIPCGELTQRFTIAHTGGVAPDVAQLGSHAVVNLGSQGALLPLTPLLERDGISESIWFPSEIQVNKHDGIIYGLPIRTGADEGNTLFYNRDHFDRVGLPDRSPATWEEFREFSRRLVVYDGDEIVTGAIGRRFFVNYRWLYTAGGSLLSDDLRTVTFDSPEGLEAAEFFYDYMTTVYRSPSDWGGDRAEFHGESISMVLSGAYELSQVEASGTGMRVGFGLIPLKDLGPQYVTTNAGTHNYVISRTTDKADLAWELVKWLTIREESAGKFMLQQGRPSPVIAFNMNPLYLEVNPEFPKFQEILSRAVPIPMLPVLNQITTPFNVAFDQIVQGRVAARSALTDAARTAQAALDQYWKELEQ